MQVFRHKQRTRHLEEQEKPWFQKGIISRMQQRQGSLLFDAENLSLNLQIGQETSMLFDW